MSGQALLPEAKRQAAVSRITRTLLISILLASLQLSFGPIFSPQMMTNSAQATTPEMIQTGLALDINASNATDRSNLTSGGSPAYTSTGGGYYTLSSASSQYLMNSTTPVTQGAGNKFSVFMWVYPTNAGQLLSHLGQTQINALYHTSIIDYTNSDQMIFGLWRSQGGQGTVTSTIATPKNNWYHIGLVYDGTKITAYINGASAGTSADFVFSPPANSYFGIGAIDSTIMVQAAGYGNMRFGSLSVYNRELTGSEVSTNFASTTQRFGPTVSNPSNVSTFANKSATFSSSTCSNTTSGSATCNYQWQVSTDAGTTWSSISGANSITYTTPVLTSSYNGYRYRLIASDPGIGVTAASDIYATTSVATLSVAIPPGSETDTALTFGANKYAWAPDSNELDVTSAITMQAWVYQTETNSFWNMVMNKENSYQLGTYGSVWSFGLQGSGGWAGVQTGVSTRLNEWQHVALTRAAGSSTANFYLNGQLAWTGTADGASTGGLTNSSQPFTISGRSSDGVNFSSPFVGRIDEVKVFRSARSQSDIASDMHTYGPIDSANLILYYDFNEGTGSVLFNRTSGTSTASDLSIVGSPTWGENVTSSIFQAYTIRTFTRSYLTSTGGWKVPAGVSKVTALVVAGGGGAGFNSGGGGSGGGVSYQGSLSVSGNIAVTVGVGGRGATSNGTATAGTSSTFGATNASGGNGGVGPSGAGGTSVSGSGAGGAGSTSSSVVGTNGANGPSYSITGVSVNYAGGGGGGGWIANSVGGTGGSGGGAAGGGGGASSRTGANNNNGASGTPNTGGGGGGGSVSSATSGNGGSGIIIIRWITATAPIFTGPSSDTLTAGMVETFTASNNPNSPLTRNFRWQVSTDTGTTWVNATTGTGITSANYVTDILETSTSGTRYRYRVVVTDSDTAGLSIVETSTAIVFLTINPRITISGSSVSLTQKYGETQTVIYTIANGTGTRTTSASPNNRTGITWSSVSGSAATLGIGAGLGFGTYYETLTVTDSVTASASQMITISISKADTITVTVNNPSALNYTGATASFTPSVSFSGLKSTDTATASSVTITQTRSGATCAMGGTCVIGDRGPGGGIVFITPSTVSGNGKYFEAAPDAWYGANDLSTVGKFCIAGSYRDNTNEGATQFGIGWGETNTAIFRVNCTGGAVKLATDYRGGGFSNWFVPNKNELAEMAKIPSTVDLINVTNYWGYWSSTEDGSGPASTMSSLTSSSWTMGAVSKSEATRNMVRPVRMFTPCHAVDSCTAFASTTMPTNAGTYRLTPSALSLDSGSLSNYQGVSYASGVLTINKINQTPITIGQYDAFPGISTYPLNVYGGTGTGVMRRTLTSAGTANCALTNMIFITASTSGICTVSVTKAADFNYNLQSATATIYWIPFINRYTSSGPTTPTDLGLSGSTGYERRSYETFTVLSFANEMGTAVTSAAKNTVMRIIGTGFDANDATTEVIIGFFSIPRSSLTFNTTNPLANYVEFTLPNSSDLDAGANDVAMKSRKGWAFAPSLLNVTG